jgi:hypothetical protein
VGTVVGKSTIHLLTRIASPRISELAYTQPHILHLRDGEVVLFKRNDSPLWQCRFKLRDYMEILLYTGMRHGTEAMGLATQSFDSLLSSGCKELLFKTTSGYQPRRLDGTFRGLLRDCGLEVGAEGQTRTLYCLRHTYATMELLTKGIDIHILAKQMGNSAAVIERHYSKITASLAADQLA